MTRKSRFPVLLSEAPDYGAHRGSAGTGSSSQLFSDHEPALSQLLFLLLLFLSHTACALWTWLFGSIPSVVQLWVLVCQLFFRNTQTLLTRLITVSNSSADDTSIPSTGGEQPNEKKRASSLQMCVFLGKHKHKRRITQPSWFTLRWAFVNSTPKLSSFDPSALSAAFSLCCRLFTHPLLQLLMDRVYYLDCPRPQALLFPLSCTVSVHRS